jgi:hypothetical protein
LLTCRNGVKPEKARERERVNHQKINSKMSPKMIMDKFFIDVLEKKRNRILPLF